MALPKYFDELETKDWLSRFLSNLELSPLRVFFLLLAFSLVFDIVLALSVGAFLPNENSFGLKNDHAAWLYELIVFPVSLAYLVWLFDFPKKFFGKLYARNILKQKKEFKSLAKRLRDRLMNPTSRRLLLILAALLSIWVVLAFSTNLLPTPYPSWITRHPSITLIRTPFTFLVFYSLFLSIHYLWIIITELNNLLRDKVVQVEPLHSDGGGGLGVVGRFSANLAYLIASIGLVLGLRYLQFSANLFDSTNTVILTGIFIYIFLAPIIFFWPLWSTHVAMRNSRDALLDEISREFDVELRAIADSRWKNSEDNKRALDKMDQLGEASKLVKDMPVWPFNLSDIRQYFGFVISPILPGLISTIQDNILQLFK